MLTRIPDRPRFLEGYLGLSLATFALFAAFSRARDEQGQRKLLYPYLLVAFGLCAVCLGQCRFDFVTFIGVSVLAADGVASLARRGRPALLVPLALALMSPISARG